MGSTPIEEPVADVVEQHQEIVPDETAAEGSDRGEETPERGWEVDEGDAAEQGREVASDEDERR